jgi:hypothetical protein
MHGMNANDPTSGSGRTEDSWLSRALLQVEVDGNADPEGAVAAFNSSI